MLKLSIDKKYLLTNMKWNYVVVFYPCIYHAAVLIPNINLLNKIIIVVKGNDKEYMQSDKFSY